MARTPATSPSGRPRRSPLENRSKLAVRNQEAGYHYRFVNANLEREPERIQDFLDRGYEIVPKSQADLGDKQVDSISALGSASEVSVGMGTKAIVMRIRKDWFEEDQRIKQSEVDAKEATIKQRAGEGFSGKVEFETKRTPD